MLNKSFTDTVRVITLSSVLLGFSEQASADDQIINVGGDIVVRIIDGNMSDDDAERVFNYATRGLYNDKKFEEVYSSLNYIRKFASSLWAGRALYNMARVSYRIHQEESRFREHKGDWIEEFKEFYYSYGDNTLVREGTFKKLILEIFEREPLNHWYHIESFFKFVNLIPEIREEAYNLIKERLTEPIHVISRRYLRLQLEESDAHSTIDEILENEERLREITANAFGISLDWAWGYPIKVSDLIDDPDSLLSGCLPNIVIEKFGRIYSKYNQEAKQRFIEGQEEYNRPLDRTRWANWEERYRDHFLTDNWKEHVYKQIPNIDSITRLIKQSICSGVVSFTGKPELEILRDYHGNIAYVFISGEARIHFMLNGTEEISKLMAGDSFYTALERINQKYLEPEEPWDEGSF